MSLTTQLESKKTALTVADVAKLLSVSPKTIYRMAEENELEYIRVRGALRFDPSSLITWLEKQKPQCAKVAAKK